MIDDYNPLQLLVLWDHLNVISLVGMFNPINTIERHASVTLFTWFPISSRPTYTYM